MRVLFVIAHTDKGGGQVVQCLQLVRRLLAEVDGELLALSSGSEAPVPFGLPVETVGRLHVPGGLLDLKRAIRSRLSRFDLVQAFDSYYALPAARLARARPLVLRSGAHPVEDLASRYGTAARLALGVLNPWLLADTTLVVNAEHLRTAYAPRPTICIPNGVDTDRFSNLPIRERARRDLDLPVEGPWVVFTGKIIPRKNIEDLYALLRAVPEAQLLLIGSDQEPYYGDRYHRQIRADFPDVLARVRAVGEVPPDRIPQYLAAGDIFLFPSRLEGMPNSVLEAMAAGLPVVAADTPAHRELLAPDLGCLYRDRTEMVAAVRGLLGSPERARAMGRAGHRVVEERHSLASAAAAYLRLYGSLLALGGVSRR